MASDTGKLTVLKVKTAPPGKHFDGGGLFLHVTERGRYWRVKYRHAGKEKWPALDDARRPVALSGEGRRTKHVRASMMQTAADFRGG